MFDLTKNLDDNRRAKLVAAIKEGARLIQACPDERKRWRAMGELRKLQIQLRRLAD